MTLKERFKEQKLYINPYDFKLTKESAADFEKIAEEFTCDFLCWFKNQVFFTLRMECI